MFSGVVIYWDMLKAARECVLAATIFSNASLARFSGKTSIMGGAANAGNRHRNIWMRRAVPQGVERGSPVANRGKRGWDD